MNTAELTALHTETLNEIRRERLMGNITRRAKTLFQDGYTAEKFATGLYHVWGPQGQHYMVLCDEVLGHDCDCPCYKEHGECKHHLAISDAVSDAQAAEYDTQEAERDAFYFVDERWHKYDYRN